MQVLQQAQKVIDNLDQKQININDIRHTGDGVFKHNDMQLTNRAVRDLSQCLHIDGSLSNEAKEDKWDILSNTITSITSQQSCNVVIDKQSNAVMRLGKRVPSFDFEHRLRAIDEFVDNEPGIKVRNVYFDYDRLSLRAETTNSNRKVEVLKDDLWETGIAFDLIRESLLSLSPFYNRLICSNGLRRQQPVVTRNIREGGRPSVMAKAISRTCEYAFNGDLVRDRVKHLNQFNTSLAELKSLLSINRITSNEDIEAFADNEHIDIDSMLIKMKVEKPRDLFAKSNKTLAAMMIPVPAYDVFNIATYHATHNSNDSNTRNKLNMFASKMLFDGVDAEKLAMSVYSPFVSNN